MTQLLILIKDLMLRLMGAYAEKGQEEDIEDFEAEPYYVQMERLVERYTQRKWSELHSAIQEATGFSNSQTVFSAQRACKIICFYIELVCKERLDMSLWHFLRWSYENKCIEARNSKMLKTQVQFLEMLKQAGLLRAPVYYSELTTLPAVLGYRRTVNWIGTVRIHTGFNDKGERTFHSMLMYNKNGNILIADPSTRGIGKRWEVGVSYDNFQYFTSLNEEA